MADVGSRIMTYHPARSWYIKEELEELRKQGKLPPLKKSVPLELNYLESKWWVAMFLNSNEDIGISAKNIAEILGCEVKIRDEVYVALGHPKPSEVQGPETPPAGH